jgi:myosin-5
MLVPSKEWQENDDVRALCGLILSKTLEDEDKYQIGLTKIFFRAGMLAFLESLRTQRINQLVTLVQKNVRRRIAYKQYQQLRNSTITIQAWWRGVMARKYVEELRRQTAAVKIQRVARGWLARKEYVRTREAVIKVQAGQWECPRYAGASANAVQSCAGTRRESGPWRRGPFPRFSSSRACSEDCERCCTLAQSPQCRTILMVRRSARRRSKSQVRQVVLLQSQWRRKLAVRELRGLRAEAKSASKFKEQNYQLENKVVDLTQRLRKKDTETKGLGQKISLLEQQLAQWQGKHDEVHSRAKSLETELSKPTVPMSQWEELMGQKEETTSKLREAEKRVVDGEKQIAELSAELNKVASEWEETRTAHDAAVAKNHEDLSTIQGLRAELSKLKEDISRSNTLNALTKGQRELPPSPTLANGFRTLENLNGERGPSAASRRRARRHSAGAPGMPHARKLSHDDIMAIKKSNAANHRAVSVMFPSNGPMRPRDSNGLPTVSDNSQDEVVRILEDEEGLDEDVLQGLIYTLKIPPPLAKEVIFPAHLISVVSNEMWKLNMIPESERFLANVMQAIQGYVMVSDDQRQRATGTTGMSVTHDSWLTSRSQQFKGEDCIMPGIFWLSNVHEILSFICLAESDVQQGIGPGSDEGRPLDWDTYERLITVVKQDLDSLEYNIYHTWMLEVKKKLQKMVIPALIESQSLPGFITSDGSGRMFSRMLQGMQGNQQPTASMDDILNLLNKVWKCLKSYYMEESVMQQVVTELLKLIGQVAFNDLIMRRNFCSWKRGKWRKAGWRGIRSRSRRRSRSSRLGRVQR